MAGEANSFFARTEELEEMVGDGRLTGTFAVEKVYAVNQHEQGWRNYLGAYGPKEIEHYHRGGGPKFVEQPLKERWPEWYEKMAKGVLEGTLRDEMESAMEDLYDELQERAPLRDGELRRAGSYYVTDDGQEIARKDPETPYEVETPGNPPGPIINLLKQAGKL